MRKVALAVAAVFTALAPAAFGQDYRYFDSRDNRDNRDTARVLESTPVYESANVREECWNPRARQFEMRREGGRDSLANGTILGAIAGGVLGHQVDRGGGTAAGAILGGILGNQIDRGHDRYGQSDLDLSRCRRVADNSGNLLGYDVRYVYRGQEYRTRMARDPGRWLFVGEDIRRDGTPIDTVASYESSYYASPQPVPALPVYDWR